VESEFGRKRAIDQSACNKDYSCLKGFCPSFVTVDGGRLRRGRGIDAFPESPPTPTLASTTHPYGILVTGVGGTGVITLGALIGTAAHIDGKGATVLDMTGLAQKGGAVFSHVRLCDDPAQLHAVRIATGEADAVIGGDAIVTASGEALARMQAGRTRIAVNSAAAPTAEFTHDPNWQFPAARMRNAIAEAVGTENFFTLDASRLAYRLLGDTIGTNLLLLGYAWQLGMVPVSAAALDRAIELNGTAVDMNRRAFLWGRCLAHDPSLAVALMSPTAAEPTLDERIARRSAFLADYQDAAYAARYAALVEKVRAAETPLGSTRLTTAVAENYFKLLAIKDEYEVARLFSATEFRARLDESFEGDYTLKFHLSPPWFSAVDPATGRPKKREFGPWLMVAFRGLARLRRLRGTSFDPFGYSTERRAERRLIADYAADIAVVIANLSAERLDAAVALASLPAEIRGFGPVKQQAMATAEKRRQLLVGNV